MMTTMMMMIIIITISIIHRPSSQFHNALKTRDPFLPASYGLRVPPRGKDK